MKNGKLWLRAAAVLMIGGASAFGIVRYKAWSGRQAAIQTLSTNKAVAVTAEFPHNGTVKQTIGMTGTVQSKNNLDITAAQSASVKEIDADVGQSVQAGAVLAKLDSSVQETNLLEAEGSLRLAQARYEQQSSSNPNDVNIAKDNVAIARAKLNLLENGADPDTLNKAQIAYQAAVNKLDSMQKSIAFEQSAQSPDSLAIVKNENELNTLKDGTSTVVVSNNNSDVNSAANLQAADQNLADIQSSDSQYGQAAANAQTDLDNAEMAEQDYMSAINVTSDVYAGDPKLTALHAVVVNDQEALALAQSKWDDAIQSAKNAVYQKQVSSISSSNLNQSQLKQAEQNAQAAVDMAKAYQSDALQKLNQQLVNAQDAVTAVKANLQALGTPPNPDEVQQAQANLQAAESKLEQAEHPADPATIDALSASVDIAKAKVKAAQTALDQMTIRAPFAGTITQRSVSAGSAVRAGSVLFTLMGKVKELTAQVDEQHMGAIRPGDSASFSLVSDSGNAYPAKVVQISPAADAQSLSFNVVLMPVSDSALLIPGETASVKVEVRDIPDALMVPAAAVVSQNGHPQVFVVGADGKAVLKDVDTGYNAESPAGRKRGNVTCRTAGHESRRVEPAGRTDPKLDEPDARHYQCGQLRNAKYAILQHPAG